MEQMRADILSRSRVDIQKLVEGDAIFLKARQFVGAVVNFEDRALRRVFDDEVAGQPVLHLEAGRHLYGGAAQVLLLLQGLRHLPGEHILLCRPEAAIRGIFTG